MRKESKIHVRQNRAASIAEKSGRSKQYVYRAAEYYRAIEILANTYGRDIRDLIINHHVRLSHAALVRLAGAVERSPEALPDLGQIIRAGNTRLLKSFIPCTSKKK